MGKWLNNTHWVDYDPESGPVSKRKLLNEESAGKDYGCIRTRGFYSNKAENKEKSRSELLCNATDDMNSTDEVRLFSFWNCLCAASVSKVLKNCINLNFLHRIPRKCRATASWTESAKMNAAHLRQLRLIIAATRATIRHERIRTWQGTRRSTAGTRHSAALGAPTPLLGSRILIGTWRGTTWMSLRPVGGTNRQPNAAKRKPGSLDKSSWKCHQWKAGGDDGRKVFDAKEFRYDKTQEDAQPEREVPLSSVLLLGQEATGCRSALAKIPQSWHYCGQFDGQSTKSRHGDCRTLPELEPQVNQTKKLG